MSTRNNPLDARNLKHQRWLAIEGDLGISYLNHIEIDGAIDGLPVDLEFDVIEEDGRLTFDRLVLKHRAGIAIDSTVMRGLPLPGLLLRALSSSFGIMRSTGRGRYDSVDLEQLDDEDRAVLSYKLAYAIGKPPTAAVAEHFGITPAAAAKRVERLRVAGRLGETEPGRKRI